MSEHLGYVRKRFWDTNKFGELGKVVDWRFRLFIPYKKNKRDKKIDAEWVIIYVSWIMGKCLDGQVKNWTVILFNKILINVSILQRARRFRAFGIRLWRSSR